MRKPLTLTFTAVGLAFLAWGVSAGQPPADDSFPRIAPKSPAEEAKTFEALDGFQMELLAAEPLVSSPVALAYDEDGAAYVVEMYDYPYTDKATHQPWKENTTDLPLGRVRVLRDEDGDGRFDSATVLADRLSWPTGIALWKGGAFVTATPDLWYLKDTDGDGRADVRDHVYTGFRKFNVQAVINNLAWGLDHTIYGAGGTNGASVRPGDRPDAKPVTLTRNDFRFDPVTQAFAAISGGARFGNTFDDWGNRFLCNIRNPVIHVVLPNHYIARNPFLPVAAVLHDAAPAGDLLPVYRVSPPEPWRAVRSRRFAAEQGKNYPRSELNETSFTSSSGVTVYRGTAYPAKYHGNVFLGEVSGNLIHRQTLTPDGVTFKAERADLKTEFVRSTDNWFRPVNLVNAPDGTLHVLDMYRETIEHPWSIPDDIHDKLDLLSGRDRGRLWRLAPPNFQAPAPPRLSRATTAELVALLENRNAWWRETAHRLIYERQDVTAVNPLRRLLTGSDKATARLAALWSLDGLKSLRDEDLAAALRDGHPAVREHAVRLAETRLARSPALLDRVLALAADPEVRVRFQVAFTLGNVSDPRAADALFAIARRDAADPWVRTAVLSSAAENCDQLLLRVAGDDTLLASPAGQELARALAVVVGARNRAGEVRAVLAALADRPAADDVLFALGDGLKRAGKGLRTLALDPQTPASRRIDAVLTSARRDAGDAGTPPARRLPAIQRLAYDDFPNVQPTLGQRLDARESQEVQLAAVRTLSAFPDRRVAPLLLGAWRGLTPAVRAEAVEALLARKDRLPALLDAVAAKTVSPGEIPPARRDLLMKHADASIRARAASLFNKDTPGSRQAVFDRYRAALSLAPERSRGTALFVKHCSTCHRLDNQGTDIGPNLVTVQHLTAEEILTSILDPNREVSPNFLEYLVTLKDGRVTSGVIAAESATSLTLRRAGNVEETVLRQGIDEITGTGRSLMPEGLEQQLSVQDMADLLAVLVRPR